ncbi:mannosyltransferase family protein [Streptomyces sp. NPDC021212]|uniref:mannosyltransferase family protein n=1 Tax=Streptomyces sp. NPDC021212 TaxID=3365118 RepID=UPI0037B14D47
MSVAPPEPRPATPSAAPGRPTWSSAPRERPSPRRRLIRRARLAPGDREVLWLYLLTRISLWISAYCVRWLFPGNGGAHEPSSLLEPFERWDWGHYLHIARDGYFPGESGPWDRKWDSREAFFPGFPMLLRALHTVIPNWSAAGLLISFAAGAVGVLALARIARLYLPGPDGDRRAVLFFLLSPCAVFLAVGYTEALFLAFALPGWLAAQRHRWAAAALLTALATTVRVSGLFVAAAIAVHFVLSAARARGHWRSLPWLALPALPAGLYSWYLHAHTGDWMAWKHAQERGWFRTFHTPWEGWSHTWQAAFDQTQTTGYAAMFQAELVAMVLGLVVLGVLLWRRRWAEAVYIGVTLWALGTSYWFMSIPRSTLLWWPLWIGLAGWSLRTPRVRTVYYCLVAPVSTVFTLAFLSGRWAG